MCTGLWSCFVDFLVYFWIVTLPVFGSFCGVEIILKLSIVLYIYVILCEFVPKILSPVLSHVHFIILALLVGYLPLNLIPYSVTWVYDKILWLTEPSFLLSEVILIQNFVLHYSQSLADKIGDGNQSDVSKWKILVIVFSVVCYGAAFYMGWDLYTETSATQLWFLFVVVILLLAIHNMMWMSMNGILSDAAFCSLLSVSIVYSMHQETDLIQRPLKPPDSWFKYDRKQSLFVFTMSIVNSDMANALLAIEFLKKFLKPFFLLSFGMRLYSILYMVDKVTKKLDKFDEEGTLIIEESEIQSRLSPWRSNIIMKLTVIFLFTQVTINLFHESSGSYLTEGIFSKLVHSIWPREILFGRIIQILAVNAFYVWRLYCAEDWTWSEWFSSS